MGYYYRVTIDTNPMPISYSIEHSLTSSTTNYVVSPLADPGGSVLSASGLSNEELIEGVIVEVPYGVYKIRVVDENDETPCSACTSSEIGEAGETGSGGGTNRSFYIATPSGYSYPVSTITPYGCGVINTGGAIHNYTGNDIYVRLKASTTVSAYNGINATATASVTYTGYNTAANSGQTFYTLAIGSTGAYTGGVYNSGYSWARINYGNPAYSNSWWTIKDFSAYSGSSGGVIVGIHTPYIVADSQAVFSFVYATSLINGGNWIDVGPPSSTGTYYIPDPE
jgi:hypothetical protein